MPGEFLMFTGSAVVAGCPSPFCPWKSLPQEYRCPLVSSRRVTPFPADTCHSLVLVGMFGVGIRRGV